MWPMVATHFLKTRVTAETKVRVLNVTRELSVTEAAWLRHLVVRALRERQGSLGSSVDASARLWDHVVARREAPPGDRGRASRLFVPAGTSAKGVLEAARNFARDEFALKHRCRPRKRQSYSACSIRSLIPGARLFRRWTVETRRRGGPRADLCMVVAG